MCQKRVAAPIIGISKYRTLAEGDKHTRRPTAESGKKINGGSRNVDNLKILIASNELQPTSETGLTAVMSASAAGVRKCMKAQAIYQMRLVKSRRLYAAILLLA